MSVKSVVSAFTGFLTKHVADLSAVGSALNSILSAVPVNAETRAHIADVISRVEASADNIAAWIKANPTLSGGGEVVVKQSDIVKAVGDYFKANPVKPSADDIASAVAAYLKANPPVAPATDDKSGK